ncbi:hypothetical protein DSO57_1011206 [Entomophthora muscae]|uniref:Uncharacterized protein n=1 Tax=Entomophthora muscae TaxID=34485 RepID=A0ACC2US51_9FUNG|nr:hypothetical protein DSO57_1011206 [Entomophthora muscae]
MEASQDPLGPYTMTKNLLLCLVPLFFTLFHNISSNYEPEDSDYNETDTYGYSVLAVPKTVSVPYKLCSWKTTTKVCPSLAEAKVMMAHHYLAQAYLPLF